jgi:anaerobic ribonucleoside-triphosphate reductase activating protein
MTLRVHRILEKTQIAGPGWRFSVWVQGCRRHCQGCLAPETWDKDGGYSLDTQEIIDSATNAPDIEGITFLGGEPFEQAQALALIGKALREQGLSVVTFTGYTLEELREADDHDYNELLAVTDLLIDGAFDEEQKSLARPWVGSSNQRFLFLTERYTEKDIIHLNNKLEVRIFPDGRARVTGMGDFPLFQEYLR